jgi:hypothetical protein
VGRLVSLTAAPLGDLYASGPRNAPLWPALDSGVRLVNELHAAPALIAHSLPKGPGPQL